MKKFAIVFGSSRSNGHTMTATEEVMQEIELLHLTMMNPAP